MKAKKMIVPILTGVLMAFAILSMAAGIVFADEDDVYTVTVAPGTGTGNAFTVQSTEILTQSDMDAGNYDKTKGCFFRYDGDDTIYYRTPDNPFTAPEGKEFDCWACISKESVFINTTLVLSMPAFADTTFTALWKKSVEPTTVQLGNSGNIKYGEEKNVFGIRVLNESFDQETDDAIIQLHNSSFTCISHDGTIPFTFTPEENGDIIENGCSLTATKDEHAYELLGKQYVGEGNINITNEAWAAAESGTYIAIVEAEVSMGGKCCGSREIVFMLVVPDKYSLWVGDTQVTSENAANITGSDPVQASYDADSNTLTLNNYTYDGFGCDNDDVKAAIKARMDDDFTIDLNGDNTVKHVYKETSAGAGIYADNNMTITGEGTLTVSDGDNADNYNSRGIRVGKELTIGSGAAVNASSGEGQNSYGVNVKKLAVQGELNAAGGSAKNSYGVYTSDNVTVSEDGTLNADGGTATNGSYGVFIYNTSPSMTIEGAMTARGNTYAIAKAALPNPSIDTAAIQYTVPVNYVVTQLENYDGIGATLVAAGEKTSATAKYVRIVGSAPVTGVFLNKTSTALAEGDSETLTAALKPEYALHPDLVWESNDPSVATVSKNGIVTAVAAGSATITVTATNGTEDTSDDYSATCDVTVKSIVTVAVPTGKTLTYNGKSQTGVAESTGYTLTGTTNATNAGSYTAKAALKTDDNYTYKWSDDTTEAKTIIWTITPAANPLKIKAKTATVKGSTKGKKGTLKKTKTLAVTKVIKFISKGQGTKTYVKKSGNPKIKIAKTTGKVTVKKGLKKGTYKVKVKVKAKGNSNYKASTWKVVSFTVKVH